MKKFFVFLILFFSLCACFPIFCQDGETSESKFMTLKQIDVLIKNTEYDVALSELNKYLSQKPEEFDKVQKRIKKIIYSRDLYAALAKKLLIIIREEPDNIEKIGTITEQLVKIEINPLDRRLDIVKDTNKLIELAKYSRIQNDSANLVEQRQFSQAISRANEGFFIYDLDFQSDYANKPLAQEVLKNRSVIDSCVFQFANIVDRIKIACKNYNDALKNEKSDEIQRAVDNVTSAFGALADIRNKICEVGVFFKDEFEKTGKKQHLESSQYLKFSSDTIFGWSTSPDCGILGAIDAVFNIYLEEAKKESVKKLKEISVRIQNESDWFEKKLAPNLQNAEIEKFIKISNYSLKLNSIYEMLLENDLKNYRKSYKNYDIAINFALKLSEFAKNYSLDAIEVQSIFAETSKFYDKNNGNIFGYFEPAISLENFTDFKNTVFPFAENLLNSSNLIDQKSGALSNEKIIDFSWAKDYKIASKEKNLEKTSDEQRTTAGIQINDELIDWNEYIFTVDKLRTSISSYSYDMNSNFWQKIAHSYSFFGETAVRYSKNQLDEQNEYVDGKKVNIDDETVYKYPAIAISKNSKNVETASASKKSLQEIQKTLDSSKYSLNYTSYSDSIKNSIARLDEILLSLKNSFNKATVLMKQFEKTKNEADTRLNQARRALNQDNFEIARKRLQESSEKYVECLSYNNDENVRNASDTELRTLGEEIKQKENILVVREVRALKNQARNEYYNGNFEQAEKILNRAKSRWADTQVEEDAEIVNLLAIVETALSMKTGRVILPSDSLYAEMSQVLNMANQYYKQGSALLKKNKNDEAKQKFNLALEKLEQLRLVYPLNQEASLLTLKIQQSQNPEEFKVRFSQKVQVAKNDYKKSENQRQAYLDLLDLYEINPNYPGLKQLIYDVEMEIGIRKKPVQKSDASRSDELFAEAERIFNSAGKDMSKLHQAQIKVDQAIALNADNAKASFLKDEITIRMGGTVSVVLSVEDEAKYNRAVQELQKNNVIIANALVEQLLQKPQNRNSSRILELQKRIKGRM